MLWRGAQAPPSRAYATSLSVSERSCLWFPLSAAPSQLRPADNATDDTDDDNDKSKSAGDATEDGDDLEEEEEEGEDAAAAARLRPRLPLAPPLCSSSRVRSSFRACSSSLALALSLCLGLGRTLRGGAEAVELRQDVGVHSPHHLLVERLAVERCALL